MKKIAAKVKKNKTKKKANGFAGKKLKVLKRTKVSVLSERETEILQNMANGLSSKNIADKLCISFDTVESHRKSIHRKIGVNTATEAIAFGFRNGLLN
ncbi:MAG TPA: LuxR C-terminal-related transcriptional regulator [Chitinophagales bacterium]|nr:LuxR C-terminal-related transcriptional regulator [Chitinophagales bacterium]